MGLWGSGAGHSVVGLDLGSSSIKLVQLVNKGEGWKLVRAVLREIEHSEDPSTMEKEKVTALNEILKGVPLANSKIIVSVNSPEIDLKIFEVPPMPKAELKKAVGLEAKQRFLFPIENSMLDLEEDEVVQKGNKKHRAIIALSPKKNIYETLSLLKQVGVRPVSVVPSASALRKLAAASTDANTIRCVMEIGDAQSELLIFKERHLVFCRKIPLGGRDFTRAMLGVFVSDQGKVELSWSEAETIKRQVGFPLEGTAQRVGDKILGSQLHSMLRSPLEQLANEIERCIDYYHEGSGEERMQSVVLLGRGAYLKGLPSFLSEALGMEVRLGNPLEEIKMEAQIVIPEEGFSHFATAFGAALTLGDGLNLLPPEIKEEAKRVIQRATLQSVLVIAILAFVFSYMGLKIQLNNFEKRITVAQMEVASLQFDLGEMERQREAQKMYAEQPHWEDVFKELGNQVPRGVALTELRADEGEKKIIWRGLIHSFEREAVLSAFIRDLEKGIFKNMKLIKVEEKQDQSASQFELEGWVDFDA